jgi:hypothetical protein
MSNGTEYYQPRKRSKFKGKVSTECYHFHTVVNGNKHISSCVSEMGVRGTEWYQSPTPPQ